MPQLPQDEFLSTFLEEALVILESWEDACTKLEADFASAHVNQLFRAAHNLKGAAKSVFLGNLADFIHSVEDIMLQIRDLGLKPDRKTIKFLLQVHSLLVQWISHLEKNRDYKPDLTRYATQIQRIKKSQGSPASTKKSRANTGLTLFEEDAVPSEVVQINSEKTSLRIRTSKIDSYIRNTAELSVHISMLLNRANQLGIEEESFVESLSLCKKIITELHEESLSMRLQSVDSLFKRLARMAKDTADTLKKEVSIATEGTEVELDKTILDKIKDPMIHLIRNAVDHGIETGEQRQKAGKSNPAWLKISAQNLGDTVTLTISDDGRGINQKQVLKKAVESGICKKDPETMTSEEIMQLIFAPGLSTAEKVTDISGRGVGMDVVKKTIEGLSGTLAVESHEGKGTQFTVSIPTNLAVVDALIVGISGEHLAVPISDVREVIDLNDFSISENQAIDVRGKIVNAQRLKDYLRISEDKSEGKTQRHNPALLYENAKTCLAFSVDSILGIESLIVGDLLDPLKKAQGISGTTVTASGLPVMIVHLPSIVNRCISEL